MNLYIKSFKKYHLKEECNRIVLVLHSNSRRIKKINQCIQQDKKISFLTNPYTHLKTLKKSRNA